MRLVFYIELSDGLTCMSPWYIPFEAESADDMLRSMNRKVKEALLADRKPVISLFGQDFTFMELLDEENIRALLRNPELALTLTWEHYRCRVFTLDEWFDNNKLAL